MDSNDRYVQAKKKCEEKIISINKQRCVFRYFKISSFTSNPWPYRKEYEYDTFSILFLTFVILNLEQVYGQDFAIQMGIPTGKHDLISKRRKAVQLLLSAYWLAEDVFKGNLQEFLSAKYENLHKLVDLKPYSEEKKEEYFIKIFPEAYAGLFVLTKQKRIVRGMNLMVDIGGGTTDISFFEIPNEEPIIYHYESVRRGINYLTETSMSDNEEIFVRKISFDSDVLDKEKKREAVKVYCGGIAYEIKKLKERIYKEFRGCRIKIPVKRLDDALRLRPIIYSGGGSMYPELRMEYDSFCDIHHINETDWERFSVLEFDRIRQICPIMCTALGLSIEAKSDDVVVHGIETLFDHLREEEKTGYTEEYGLIDT